MTEPVGILSSWDKNKFQWMQKLLFPQRNLRIIFPQRSLRNIFQHLRNIFLCRKENNQSNNSDDYNHNDNEMVEIITIAMFWAVHIILLVSKKMNLTNPLQWNISQN